MVEAETTDNRRCARHCRFRMALKRSRLKIADVTDHIERSVPICNLQDCRSHQALLVTFEGTLTISTSGLLIAFRHQEMKMKGHICVVK